MSYYNFEPKDLRKLADDLEKVTLEDNYTRVPFVFVMSVSEVAQKSGHSFSEVTEPGLRAYKWLKAEPLKERDYNVTVVVRAQSLEEAKNKVKVA